MWPFFFSLRNLVPVPSVHTGLCLATLTMNLCPHKQPVVILHPRLYWTSLIQLQLGTQVAWVHTISQPHVDPLQPPPTPRNWTTPLAQLCMAWLCWPSAATWQFLTSPCPRVAQFNYAALWHSWVTATHSYLQQLLWGFSGPCGSLLLPNLGSAYELLIFDCCKGIKKNFLKGMSTSGSVKPKDGSAPWVYGQRIVTKGNLR